MQLSSPTLRAPQKPLAISIPERNHHPDGKTVLVRHEAGQGVSATSLYYSCQLCRQKSSKCLTCHLKMQRNPPRSGTAVARPSRNDLGAERHRHWLWEESPERWQETMLRSTSEGKISKEGTGDGRCFKTWGVMVHNHWGPESRALRQRKCPRCLPPSSPP